MERRYHKNPFIDYVSGKSSSAFACNQDLIKKLIVNYVNSIIKNFPPVAKEDNRGDLYIGGAGIAYMFWKLSRCAETVHMFPALQHAEAYIKQAKIHANQYRKQAAERYSFLCGNAGIYAVSAVISLDLQNHEELSLDLANFKSGIAAARAILTTKYGCDEVLIGRAGYLSGCYWLNEIIPGKRIRDDDLIAICKLILANGREYSKANKLQLPLMFHYHGTEYLGAAHGLSAILFMLLDSPWFHTAPISAPADDMYDIKTCIDYLLTLQDSDGNFPIGLEDLRTGRTKKLIQWCHGAPGIVYLMAKAYVIFKENKYLHAIRLVGDLVWRTGLLRKGPGLCHGIAGNAYVFLLLFRLTTEQKHLYRANKFMEMLATDEFQQRSRVPDHPFSLYEGVAGTVCFLVDLLQPEMAHFPFMNVFH